MSAAATAPFGPLAKTDALAAAGRRIAMPKSALQSPGRAETSQ